MTEKEFKERYIHMSGDRVVALAKEAGAKFDPERVELPVLGMVRYNAGPGPDAFPTAGSEFLSAQQVAEVVRRCNAWTGIGAEIMRLSGRLLCSSAAGSTGNKVGRELAALAHEEFRL